MGNSNDYIRFDWAMKHMLRDKANFGILEGLISVLLKDKVTIVEILESESNQETDTDKFNRVDIKVKNSKGHLIIVEVQLTRQLYYLQSISMICPYRAVRQKGASAMCGSALT